MFHNMAGVLEEGPFFSQWNSIRPFCIFIFARILLLLLLDATGGSCCWCWPQFRMSQSNPTLFFFLFKTLRGKLNIDEMMDQLLPTKNESPTFLENRADNELGRLKNVSLRNG